MRISRTLIALVGFAPAALTQTPADRGGEIYAQAATSVYKLLVKDESGNIVGQGTGFLAETGKIITNDHVVRGGSVVIDIGAVRLPASIEKTDVSNDLAVLSSQAELAAEPLHFASREPVPGEAVFVIGNPRGLERSISTGVLSGIRNLRGRRLLQISAPISPGSSGGPVLNAAGEVVGIAVGMLKDGQNLNFAVPAAVARDLIAGRSTTSGAAAAMIERALILREQQSGVELSFDENSEYQKLESQIRQMWQAAVGAEDKDLQVLDEIAIEAHLEDEQSAIAAAAKAAALQPTSDRQIRLGILLQRSVTSIDEEGKRKSRLEQAERLLRTGVSQKKSPSTEALVSLGWTLEARGSASEALTFYERALQGTAGGAEPFLDAFRGAVRVSYAQGRPAEGATWFKRLIDTGKATAWDWAGQAERLVAAQQYAEAGAAFQQAATMGDSWEHWCRATLNLAVGDNADDVLLTGRKCIETGSGQSGAETLLHWAHIYVGTVLKDRGLHELALSHGREAAALMNESHSAYELQADALFGLRRYHESINLAKRALRLSDGKYFSTHFRLGAAYFEVEDWESAKQSFELAASLDKRGTAAPYNIALCMVRLGFYRDAAKWYEEVLRRDPKHRDREDLLQRIRTLRQ